MAILIINEEDFTSKLKDFSLTCKKCGSKKIKLVVDWAAYPSCSWCNIDVECEECTNFEEIYPGY